MIDPTQLPESLEITLPGGIPLLLRRIPPGSFRMGSRGEYGEEEPAHLVEIQQPFYLGIFPVTQEQYHALAPLAGLDPEPSYFKDRENSPRRPVEQVTWDEAMAVCGKLCAAEWFTGELSVKGLEPKDEWQAGLPSEAMWEYACRAGTETAYWNCDGEAALAEVGWYNENSGRETHPVGELLADPWGLYGMHGNVWEWCADVWDEKAYRACVNGGVAATASSEARDAKDDRNRVLRGGSWFDSARWCRSASRYWHWPGLRFWVNGFRLCVFPGPGDASHGPQAGHGARPVDLSQQTFSPRSGSEIF